MVGNGDSGIPLNLSASYKFAWEKLAIRKKCVGVQVDHKISLKCKMKSEKIKIPFIKVTRH